MQNHGPFTIGATAKDAVKSAVMLEDVARTVHIAKQGGPVIAIARRTRSTGCTTGTRTPTDRPWVAVEAHDGMTPTTEYRCTTRQ